ncbi:hypothetical protein F5Y15DRAFT_192785 [Xylariaceae sp. FL0016]|nr:hypothetical protein F5Y15DRAFT_192785 [Xylariaceae sp. FL0016]
MRIPFHHLHTQFLLLVSSSPIIDACQRDHYALRRARDKTDQHFARDGRDASTGSPVKPNTAWPSHDPPWLEKRIIGMEDELKETEENLTQVAADLNQATGQAIIFMNQLLISIQGLSAKLSMLEAARVSPSSSTTSASVSRQSIYTTFSQSTQVMTNSSTSAHSMEPFANSLPLVHSTAFSSPAHSNILTPAVSSGPPKPGFTIQVTPITVDGSISHPVTWVLAWMRVLVRPRGQQLVPSR